MTMRYALLFAFLLLPVLAAGCDYSDGHTGSGTPDAPVTYVGTFYGGGSGALSVTIDGTAATGSFTAIARQARPELSGSYNPSTHALTLSGGGYAFSGTLVDGTLQGTWTGPNNTSGSFTTTLEGEGVTITVFCGTFSTRRDAGTFNLIRHDNALQGFAALEDGSAVGLSGEVSGTDVTFWPTSRPDQRGVATGTLVNDGRGMRGSINDPENPGSFEASVCMP